MEHKDMPTQAVRMVRWYDSNNEVVIAVAWAAFAKDPSYIHDLAIARNAVTREIVRDCLARESVKRS